MLPTDFDQLRSDIALGCRILARAGLVEDVLGHISARLPGSDLLIRCRGPHETGLENTTVDDVRRVGADGRADDEAYSAPNELPIHTELLDRHPEVCTVVHAHPPAVIAADLAGVPFVPLFGAYNIPAARLAADGIPVYPRSVLIRRRDLAAEMADHMGSRPVCVLRGHGITAIGSSVREGVVRALAVDAIATMATRVAALGGTVTAIPPEDLAELPDLGDDFNTEMVWRFHHQRLLAEQGDASERSTR